MERIQRGSARQLSVQITSCGERQTKSTPVASRRVEIFLPTAPVPPVRGCPPFKERIRLHLKILVPPTTFSIATMVNSMRQVYGPVGIKVEVASQERFKLTPLEDLDLFCPGRFHRRMANRHGEL